METSQLNTMIKTPGFLGAFAYDQIPPKPDKDFSLVINTQPSSEQGDHWLCIIYKDAVCYFFDSYGRSFKDATYPKPFISTIKQYIGLNKYKFKRNS